MSEKPVVMLKSKDVAQLLNISLRTLRRMQSACAMPPPIRLGRILLWKLTDIMLWIEAGCPRPVLLKTRRS